MAVSTLTMALIHPDLHYKDPDRNRETLVELNRTAAEMGHRLIVNTELALSGHSFLSMEDIADYTEPQDGPTIKALARIAKKHQAFICIGFAEKDSVTGICYNAAHVIGPKGKTVLSYRKINTEARWACPGSGQTDNTFDTPWGKMGVLISSDTHHGLLPRQTALRGARMILVPANCPPGGLDPKTVWKARALENGIYIAVCNRSGKDRTVNFDKAASCVFSPQGREIVSDVAPESGIISLTVPLESHGGLTNRHRQTMLQSRQPERYRAIYLPAGPSNDPERDYSAYKEDTPDTCTVVCFTGGSDYPDMAQALLGEIQNTKEKTGFHCFLIPRIFDRKQVLKLTELPAIKTIPSHMALCIGYRGQAGRQGTLVFLSGMPVQDFPENPKGVNGNTSWTPPMVDMGPIRAALCSGKDMVHPETAVACSKLGCDLIIVSVGELIAEAPLLLGVKSLERAAIAVSGRNMSLICEPPKGHQPWKEKRMTRQGICRMTLSVTRSARKYGLDNLDYDLLLKPDHS